MSATEETNKIEAAKKRIAEAHERQQAKAKAEEEAYLVRFYEAKAEAVEMYGADRLVEVNIPSVGMTLHRFAHLADHAAFSRAVHKEIDLSSCRTYTSKTVLFPDAQTFAKLVAERNPEGFVKAALAIKTAMRGIEEEEGKD